MIATAIFLALTIGLLAAGKPGWGMASLLLTILAFGVGILVGVP